MVSVDAEHGHLVLVPGATGQGSPGSLSFGGRGLCDPETRRTTRSAKGVRPPLV